MRFGLLLPILCAAALPAFQVSIDTPSLRFEVSQKTGSVRITDNAARVTWRFNASRFGEVAVRAGAGTARYPLNSFETGGTPNSPVLTFRPVPGTPEAWVRVSLKAAEDGRSLDVAWEAAPAMRVEEIRLLESVTIDNGYVVVPVREGLLIPSDSGRTFRQRFGTYDYQGCHMAMLGLVNQGAALLLTWSDPYTVAEVSSGGSAAEPLSASLLMSKSARAARLRVLGKGDYVTVGKAYREVAREKGYLVPWDRKIKENPRRAAYLGASNVKLWQALNRRMNEGSTQELSVRVEWTFDEAAQIAEHLRNDLKLQKVLFGLGGWMKRGYDNQHPDILPAAPELGGDEGFSKCARRIQALGYVLALHDNYQDIYRDSPSWSEDLIMKNADGSLRQGGTWAGGRAYLTCSRKALELARRPQNLPAVKKLTSASTYFIDTTYAAGLYECFDPKHPLTKVDDIRWKQAISDYAREVFGSFGSECGREWAIPHSDFFEGLTGVSGTYFHNSAKADLLKDTGGSVVPLFEIVYRDSIATYGKYSYDINKAAEYVLHHIAIGRPLNYHGMPHHIYWKGADAVPDPPEPSALFVRGANGWTEGLVPVDRFLKNTHEILSPLNELTAMLPMTKHGFLTADRRTQHSVFGDGAAAVEAVVNMGPEPLRWSSKLGGRIELPPNGFLVEAPTFVAFHATNWNGKRYAEPPLFTLRSADGRPLKSSRSIRVYHGFGDAEIRIGAAVRHVPKEAVIRF